MISPASILKLAAAYQVVASVNLPPEYSEMADLSQKAWREVWRGEKVKLSGRFRSLEAKLERFKERIKFFIKGGKELKKLFKAYDNSPVKDIYQPAFVQMLSVNRAVIDAFVKNASRALKMRDFTDSEMTVDDLTAFAAAVRRINSAFLGRVVLKPLDEIQPLLDKSPHLPPKPEKKKRTPRKKKQPPKPRLEEGEEVVKPGIIKRKKKDSKPAEEKEPEKSEEKEVKPPLITDTPWRDVTISPEDLAAEERNRQMMFDTPPDDDLPMDDWEDVWHQMREEIESRST